MRQLKVNIGERSYPIYMKKGLLLEVDNYISQIYKGKKILIISDDNVFPLYGQTILDKLGKDYECHTHVFPHGEQSKSLQIAQQIYSTLANLNFTRSDLIIALGGGVVGDLAGFVAATFLRGIKYVQIPTTLLAQVDSSVGGKVAVDLPEGKNLVGNFYHPLMVLVDSDTLKTLTPRFFRDGMGEVIKYGCIQSKSLFEKLRAIKEVDEIEDEELLDIIFECIDCKRMVVEEDELDLGLRMILNFGHTLGHAIEQHGNFIKESHGEAVAIGMYQIMKVAEEKGLTKSGIAAEIKALIEQYNLPSETDVPMGDLMAAIQKDKKNMNNSLNIILIKEIGEAYIHKTTSSFFIE